MAYPALGGFVIPREDRSALTFRPKGEEGDENAKQGSKEEDEGSNDEERC
jgi:hypothetical protein